MRLILLLVVALAGCDSKTVETKADWELAPREYRCTDEQMERVHKQAAWCSENTSYFRAYCYGTAFIRNCTKAQEETK
jgi:hypothetical protein